MADGDVLQLDSAQPGGSGTIEGETKFKWGAGPSVLGSFSFTAGANSLGIGGSFVLPAGKVCQFFVAFNGGEADGDEINFAFDGGGQLQIFPRKDGAVAGHYSIRWVNGADHDIDMVVTVVML